MNDEEGYTTGNPAIVEGVIAAAQRLHQRLDSLIPDLLSSTDLIEHVYAPLDYAWEPHHAYLQRFSGLGAEMLLVGMNPGHGMGNTGVPFGCPEQVRDRLGIVNLTVHKPDFEHPKRLVHGLDCPKPEVSGRRIWTQLGDRFGSPESIHRRLLIVNHCPLWMFDGDGRNITPDKLHGPVARMLGDLCDEHLLEVASALSAKAVIGVGRYAHRRIEPLFDDLHVGYVPHPSPASPFANRNGGADWRAAFDEALNLADLDFG